MLIYYTASRVLLNLWASGGFFDTYYGLICSTSSPALAVWMMLAFIARSPASWSAPPCHGGQPVHHHPVFPLVSGMAVTLFIFI
jgi:hypothetical protein